MTDTCIYRVICVSPLYKTQRNAQSYYTHVIHILHHLNMDSRRKEMHSKPFNRALISQVVQFSIL